jgi:hypothetical protein
MIICPHDTTGNISTTRLPVSIQAQSSATVNITHVFGLIFCQIGELKIIVGAFSLLSIPVNIITCLSVVHHHFIQDVLSDAVSTKVIGVSTDKLVVSKETQYHLSYPSQVYSGVSAKVPVYLSTVNHAPGVNVSINTPPE